MQLIDNGKDYKIRAADTEIFYSSASRYANINYLIDVLKKEFKLGKDIIITDNKMENL